VHKEERKNERTKVIEENGRKREIRKETINKRKTEVEKK
jgi:hypothetical protein